MTVKIDELLVISVRSKDYEGKKYYFASILENGFTNSISCSEEFYNNAVLKVRQAPLNLKGVLASVSFYKGQAKVKLL